MTKSALLLLILTWLCVGCNPATVTAPLTTRTGQDLWDNPELLPRFIQGLATSTTSTGLVSMLVYIDEGQVWEPSDFGSDVYFRIQNTAIVQIDGVTIARDLLKFFGSLDLIEKRNSRGEGIGSYGSYTTLELEVSKFSDGMHTASFQFQSRSGKYFTFSWAFKITHVNGSPRLAIPNALIRQK